MASFSLRKHKGRYSARIYDKNRTPARKEVALGTSRKSIAQPKLRKLEEAYTAGRFDPWRGGWIITDKTLDEAAAAFIDAKKAAGRRPNTIEVYTYVLRGLQEHAPGSVFVREVSPGDVRAYVHAPKKRNGEPVSNATKRHRYTHLRTFFRWVIKRGWAEENPITNVAKPRKQQRTKAFLQPDDVQKLLAAIDAHRQLRQGEPGPTPHDAWLKQMIVVAIGTGLRRGELLNLEWRDVDLGGNRLHIRARGDFQPKNGQDRAVPLVGDAHGVLQSVHEQRDPLPGARVFIDASQSPPKPDRVTRRFKFYVRKARLQNADDLHFHSLRHTTASWLTMKGVPKKIVADVLGHTTTRMADVYSHLAPGATEDAMRDVFES